MPICIALLRAVNLPHSQVAMSDLRGLLLQVGFTEPRSLLQSGNLVFRTRYTSTERLEALLESETRKRLDIDTDYMVRSAAEWEDLVAANPFPKEAQRDAGRLLVIALKAKAEPDRVGALQASIQGPEIIRGVGKQLYVVYPNGVGRSRLTSSLIEKKLGTRGTGRNWNTVLKLSTVAAELSG
jgi:uncharacterized protein (DUF1697 family)